MTLQRLPPLLLALLLGACAPARVTLPTGTGEAFPEFAAAFHEAASACRGAQTLTAALGMSGRAGRTKMRGRIDAGFAAPASLRLEGVAPFGKPVFVLVAQGNAATLVLPRDGRVLRGEPPAAIIEALAGVPLDAAQLRAVLGGCGLASATPTAGRQYPNGWAAVESGDATTYLRQSGGRWRIMASTQATLAVEYSGLESSYPSAVRIRARDAAGGNAADITLKLSQVEINVPLQPEVFDVEVPRDAVPLTLDELRRAGPLGDPRR